LPWAFSGQRSDASTGLYFYNARYYAPLSGRFVSADTIVPEPGNPQALNRYAYTLNNPLKHTDPSGHWVESAIDLAFIAYDLWDISQNGLNWENGLSLAADVAGLLLPVATGGGLAVRAAFHADDAAKALTHLDDVARAATAANRLTDTGRTLDNLADAAAGICSFSAETPVSTPNGSQPISALQPGDMVLAYHEGLGATGYYTVTASWAHVDSVIVELTIDGETVQATPEHPFFTAERGWVAAGELWPGAQVARAGGGHGVVEGVAFRRRPQAMYNLTVASAHTFFVGDGQWLVHNACGQWHHILSNKIFNTLQDHKTLKNIFERADFLVQARDLASHNGYQKWHRDYDDRVVDWLVNNKKATPEAFLEFLRSIYDEVDMRYRFPDGTDLIDDALERLP
jgi:RHS repeat-associated protein